MHTGEHAREHARDYDFKKESLEIKTDYVFFVSFFLTYAPSLLYFSFFFLSFCSFYTFSFYQLSEQRECIKSEG